MNKESAPDSAPDSTIDALAKQITSYQQQYYAGKSAISDSEFDRLWDDLKRRAPEHPLLQKIGVADQRDRVKIAHIIFMNSQDKVNTSDEFLKWVEKQGVSAAIGQHKLDGVSIELQYEQGILRQAATRGDGLVGDDVTDNIRKISGIPHTIDTSFSGGIRGEIILPLKKHAQYYPHFANCRNTAAGIIKRKDGIGSEHLTIIHYDAQHRAQPHYFADNEEILIWLKKQRFPTVVWKKFLNIHAIPTWRDTVAQRRERLPYEIDGLVIKALPIDVADRALAKPKFQIAFKFTVEEQTTQLIAVEWSQSGHLYTPIGITEPVQLAGTTVQRANLVNVRLIAQMKLHIGAQVIMSKRGEIIPKIERVSAPAAQKNRIAITPPQRCYSCKSALIIEETRVYCPNPTCPQRVLHQIRRWIEVLDIKDFGEILIQQLFDAGAIKSIADLYRLTPTDIATLERQGARSAEKALRNLHAVKKITLAKFIAGIAIENIGEKTVEKIVAAGFTSIDAILNINEDALAAIVGIGDILAKHFVKSARNNKQSIERLLQISQITLIAPTNSSLHGMSFCITGTLERISRKEAEHAIQMRGGAVRSAVSAQLTYLVTNTPQSNSKKMMEARSLNIPILTEQQLLTLVNA